MKNKTIEEKYKVLDQISHVLLRPNTYVGSNKPHTSLKWIKQDDKIIKKEMTYVPSFLKIIDEVLTNSVDESKRDGSKLNIIKISIKNDIISIWDNGGIEVVIHKDHNLYLPEVIFGNLLSGSNYDDSEERIVAGTNGLGAKLTNIFSSKFTISTCDGKNSFLQTFSNNMRDRKEAIIKKSKNAHTEISFIPDYEKFGMVGIDEDHYKMIEKRIYDLAACNNTLKIFFNDKLININNFEEYVRLYVEEFFTECNKDKSWSIAVALSENGFQQISFANSTETYDGGTHVDYVMNQIIVELREFFAKKHKVDVKPSELRNHIFLFLNSTIINPSFSSQTKEKLITEIKDFGFLFEVSKKLIQSILKSDIVNSILDWVAQKKDADDNKLQRELNRKLSKIKVDKLIDAKEKDRWKCSLGLFEGDCLEENTLVRVLRDGELLDVKIRDINIGDLVISHENKFQEVSALTKNIQYKNIIKTNIGNIECSNKHRFFVYDLEKNEFLFENVYNLDKTKHKLVKNQLCFMDALLGIDEINNNSIKMKSGEIFEVSNEHKLCVYNRVLDKFEMVEFIDLNTVDYLIVNTFTL